MKLYYAPGACSDPAVQRLGARPSCNRKRPPPQPTAMPASNSTLPTQPREFRLRLPMGT
jgi:hypothetical protein